MREPIRFETRYLANMFKEDITTQNQQFSAESYRGQSDHPEYMSYLREEQGVAQGVKTGEIMQSWSDTIIISEGFASCFPVIAFSPDGKCQMVHFSRDPWRMTDTGQYQKKLKEWKESSCKVVLMQADKSATSKLDTDSLEEIFGPSFKEIDFGVDSRFGVVIDVKKKLILVQLTDKKELRKYLV